MALKTTQNMMGMTKDGYLWSEVIAEKRDHNSLGVYMSQLN